MRSYALLLIFNLIFHSISFSQVIKPKCVEGNCKNKIGTFQYADGNVYTGKFLDRKKHGQGTMKYKDGSNYTGSWIDDLQHGNGVFTDRNGTIYRGVWSNGRQNGQFIIEYYNGSKYEGLVLNDVLHGEGKLTYNDGSVFEGTWEYGKKKKGKQTNKDGSVYSGDWLNELYHGAGKYTDNKKNIYTGNFTNGKFDGQGTMQYYDGSKLSCVWRNGNAIGDGTYTYKNGKQFKVGSGILNLKSIKKNESYFGQVKGDDVFHGFGIYSWASGAKYIGEWKEGQFEGIGMNLFSDGSRYEGQFKNDQFHGEGTLYSKDGKVLQAGMFFYGKFWDEGVDIGPQTWLTTNLRVTKFRNGDPIMLVGIDDNKAWEKAHKEGVPAYRYPPLSNSGKNIELGFLYNVHAVNDPRGLAPKGWHIPTVEEVNSLIYTLGDNPAKKIKAKDGWSIISNDKEANGTDNFGFCALPIENNRQWSRFWTCESNSSGQISFYITSNLGFGKSIYDYIHFSNSSLWDATVVRCVKDGSGLVSKPSNTNVVSKNSDGSYSEKKVIEVCTNQKYDLNYFELNKFFFESTKITITGDIVDDLFNGEGLMQTVFNHSANPSEVNNSGNGVIEKVYNGSYLFSHQLNKSQNIEGRVKIYHDEKTNDIVAVVFGVKGRCSYQVLFR